MRAILALCILASHSISHAIADKEAWEMDDKTIGDQINDCAPKIVEALKSLLKTTANCVFMQKSCAAYVDPPPDGIVYRSRRLSLKCMATQKGTPGADISTKLLDACEADQKSAAEEFMLDSFCSTSEPARGTDNFSVVVLTVEKIIEALEKAAKETPKKDPSKDDLKHLPHALAVYLDGKGFFEGKGWMQNECDPEAPKTKQRSNVLQVKVKSTEEFVTPSFSSKYSLRAASEENWIALPGKMAYNFQQKGHKDLRMLKILKAIDDLLCSESMNKKIIRSKGEASKAFKAALGSFTKI